MSTRSGDIIQPQDFSIDRLTYGLPKKLANGGKAIYMNYAGKPMYVQTPTMTAPFGISFFAGENGAPDKYSLELSFTGMENHPGMRALFDMIQAIDTRTVDHIMQTSQLLFGKTFPSIDVPEAMKSSAIKMPKVEQYAPRFSVKLPFRDGKFQFPVYDEKRNEIDLFKIINSEGKGKGARVQAIVQCSNVWVVGPRFGAAWKVIQMKIGEPAKLQRFAFLSTEDDLENEAVQGAGAGGDEDDDDDEFAAAPKAKKAAPKAARATTAVESTDEDEDDVVDGDDDLEAGAGTSAKK